MGAEDLSPPRLKREVLGAVSAAAVPACSSGFFAPNKLPPPKRLPPAGGFEVIAGAAEFSAGFGADPNKPPVLDAPAAGAVEDGGFEKTMHLQRERPVHSQTKVISKTYRLWGLP